MITVIEHGPKKIKTICPHCGCIFEYELEDVKTDTGLSLSTIQFNSTSQYVECPDCKYHVYHEYFKLEEPKEPKIWYDRIECIPCFKPGIYPTDLDSFQHHTSREDLVEDTVTHINLRNKQHKEFEKVQKANPKTCEECPVYCQTYRLGYSPCDICSIGKKNKNKN